MYKNILIVRTDRIGDVVLTTPAIKAVRDAYPDSRISVLVAPATRALIDGNEFIDEVLIDDRHAEHKGFTGYVRLVRLLARKKFDLAIIYHTKKRTNLACFLAGIPVRVGYKNNKFGFLLNRPVTDTRHLGQRHEAQYCLDLLEELDIKSDDLTMYIPVKKEALFWVEQLYQSQGISQNAVVVTIHCGASDPSKRWPEKNFADLIDILTKRYLARIILIGSADNQKIAEKIESLSGGKILNLVGKTSVAQTVGLLAQCTLLVSNDSGPVHIGAAVGTPVVSIFTRNQPGINPERWRPLDNRSRVVSVDPSQSTGISFKKSQTFGSEYMELIPTGRVLEAVDALFKLC